MNKYTFIYFDIKFTFSLIDLSRSYKITYRKFSYLIVSFRILSNLFCFILICVYLSR